MDRIWPLIFKCYHEIIYRIEYYFFLIVENQAEKTWQMTEERRNLPSKIKLSVFNFFIVEKEYGKRITVEKKRLKDLNDE